MSRVTLGTAVFIALAVPGFAQDSIAPATFSATLPVGTSTTVNKTVTVGKVSKPVDVMFLIDATGSMGPAIASIDSAFASNVSVIDGFATDVQFAVGNYLDKFQCSGDPYAYQLNQDITNTNSLVQTALTNLNAIPPNGYGCDTPESNLFGLQQAATTTSWRAGSLRIIVWVGDAPGHDPAGSATEATAIAALQAAGIKVIAASANSGPGLDSTCSSAPCGTPSNNQAARITAATGGSDLGMFVPANINAAIQTAILNAIAKYSTVSLGVSPVPAGVTVSISPASITGSFDRSTTRTFNFVETFTGTFPGAYVFGTNALVDGTSVATEADTIGVTALPPVITKSFNPAKILPGGTSVLTVSISNPNAATLPGVGFVDNFPAGVTFVSGVSNTCGGTVSHTATSITLANGSIAANGSCAWAVNVTSNEGIKANTTNAVTSSFGTGGTATATLIAALPPSLSKSFGGILTLLPNGSTGLAFTLTNPNSVVTLDGIVFSDTLPLGLLVSTPNGLVGSCDGGTITATAGGNLITLSGASLAPGASCSFGVSVTAAASELGLLTNTTSNVTSNESPAGSPASANIFVGNPFQVRFASNLPIGDSMVNVTDTGASSTVAFPTQNGNICVNVYTFSPDEQLISCCSCPVTPDGLNSLSARNDLISNTLTPGVPTSVVIKMLASTGTGTACNASTVGTGGNVLATGLAAWGTTIHALPVTAGSPATTYGVTETAFTRSTLSAAELQRITTLCGFIQTNGSGFGICKSCRLGGLAGTQ